MRATRAWWTQRAGRRALLAAAWLAAALAGGSAVWGAVSFENPHGELSISCGECHTTEGWTPLAAAPGFDHAETGFPLEAGHRKVQCASCHAVLEFAKVGSACADCHLDVHLGELGFACGDCHETTGWDPRARFSELHDATFPLTGAHRSADCAACHAEDPPFEFQLTPTDCFLCHVEDYRGAELDHVALGFPTTCENCHSTDAFSPATVDVVDHDAFFPLRGAHAAPRLHRLPLRGFRRHAERLLRLPRRRLQLHPRPEPRGARLPDELRGLPRHDHLGRRLRGGPQPVLPPERRPRRARLRVVPFRRLRGYADGLRRLSPGRLQRHVRSQPCGAGLQHRLRGLPRRVQLGCRRDRPRGVLPLAGRSPLTRLRGLPRGGLRRHSDGLLRVPSGGLRGHRRPGPRRRGLSQGLRAVPQRELLGGRDHRSLVLPPHRRPRAARLRVVPRGGIRGDADGLRGLPHRRLQQHRRSGPPGGRVPDHLRGLPHDGQLGLGLRPRFLGS